MDEGGGGEVISLPVLLSVADSCDGPFSTSGTPWEKAHKVDSDHEESFRSSPGPAQLCCGTWSAWELGYIFSEC